ncbi:P-loop NTPase fold protein [Enterobacter roggenkampii]|uniref:P-loop NTPase fold protein n=3 Tax=Enterobacter roggenkampii TaxID=1812935 RepID=UPI0037550EC9
MNEHITQALSNYIIEDNPGYAVMVTGKWGTGKTYTIKNLFPNNEIYYISLYGLSSEAEIYATLFDVMNPDKNKAKKILDKFKAFEINAFGFKITPVVMFSSFLNLSENKKNIKQKIIVFDDLERCNYDINNTLGIINRYVEHYGCRVIVLCNEEELPRKISKIKEKLFGLTLFIESDIQSAFESFTNKNSYYEFKIHLGKLTQEIFKASNHSSLRILKHVIKDCVKLLSLLDEKHKKNKEFLIETFSVFIALDIEAKAGFLSEKDLHQRFLQSVMAQDFLKKKQEENIPPIIKIDIKYPSISIISCQTISEKDLIDIIFKGVFDKKSICKTIDESNFFISERNIPSWRLIYNYHSIEDDVLYSAIERMENEFINRLIDNTGYMMHMFHLRLLLVYMNEIDKSYDEIENQCKQYIDDLYQQKRLQPIIDDEYSISSILNAYESYQYWVQPEYENNSRNIKKHLREVQRKVFQDQLPKLQDDLLKTLGNAPRKFSSLICYDYQTPAEYASIEILYGIKVDEFIETWLSLPKKEIMIIKHALINRFSHGKIDSFPKEKDWLRDIVRHVELRAEGEKGLKQFQIKSYVAGDLRNLIHK